MQVRKIDPIQPLDGRLAPAAQATRLPPTAPFRLRYHPESWETAEIDGVPCLIPSLARDTIAPGINGIKAISESGDGLGSARTMADAVRDLENRRHAEGWRFLPESLIITEPAHLPPGVAPGPVIRATESRAQGAAPGKRWHDAWTTFSAIGSLQPTMEVHHAQPRLRWLRDMARAGAFGKPAPAALEMLRAEVERELLAVGGARNHMSEEQYQERRARAVAHGERLEAAIKSLDEPEAKPEADAKSKAAS